MDDALDAEVQALARGALGRSWAGSCRGCVGRRLFSGRRNVFPGKFDDPGYRHAAEAAHCTASRIERADPR
jgi:hypothetical protein